MKFFKIISYFVFLFLPHQVFGYDEFKDKSIEFSLDDGDTETKFQYEDQVELLKQKKALALQDELRRKKIEQELNIEEVNEKNASLAALKDKNKKLQDIRVDRLEKLKRMREKLAGLNSLDVFHHLNKDKKSFWPYAALSLAEIERAEKMALDKMGQAEGVQIDDYQRKQRGVVIHPHESDIDQVVNGSKRQIYFQLPNVDRMKIASHEATPSNLVGPSHKTSMTKTATTQKFAENVTQFSPEKKQVARSPASTAPTSLLERASIKAKQWFNLAIQKLKFW